MSKPSEPRLFRHDPLHRVRSVKRWTQIIVFGTIIGFIPINRFLLGMSWPQFMGTAIAYAILGIVAIEYAFANFFKLRKRSAYPSMLAVELGSRRDLEEACKRSVDALAGWLNADAALLAFLHRDARDAHVVAAHGFPPGRIRFEAELAAHLQLYDEAIRQQRIVSEPLGDAHPWFAAFGSGRQVVYVPLVSMDKAVGVLGLVADRRSFDLKDRTLLTGIGRIMGLTLDNVRLYNHEYQAILHLLSSALDLRGRASEGHSRRVVDLSLAVARQFNLDSGSLLDIERAAILHDIGNIAVPDATLCKAGPLTAREWEEIRRHPEVGYQMVKDVPFLHQAAEIVYAHHERFDGSGYPRGLRGEEIPLGARIFAVVDAYDAITSDRPYRKARPHGQALDEVRAHVGIQFDPGVVDAFLRAERLGLIRSDHDSAAPWQRGNQIAAYLFPHVM